MGRVLFAIRLLVMAMATLAAGCSTMTSPAAVGSGPASGQWQLVIEVDNAAGAGRMPSQTLSMCSTPEDKKQWQEMVSGKASAGCAIQDYQASGATIRYALRCGDSIEGAATITVVDEDHYNGESTL